MGKTERYHLALTPQERVMLETLAEEESRSMNGQLIFLLKQAWGDRPPPVVSEDERG